MKAESKSEQILNTLRSELPYLEEKYKVASLSLFGSYVKNKQTPQSDLDILVTYREAPGFIEFMKLEHYLSDKLGIEVDLVMKDALKKNIGDRIKEEVISV